MGGKLPLAGRPNGRDRLALISPLFKRRRQPARLRGIELYSDVIATSTDHKLKPTRTGRPNLQAFQRRF